MKNQNLSKIQIPLFESFISRFLLRRGFALIGLALASVGFLPVARGQTCRDGCFYTNTYQGDNALPNDSSASDLTAFGFDALFSNTTGYSNTAVGALALLNNTDGSENTAIGVAALTSNDSGSQNTAVGDSALANNTSGGGNTALGDLALTNNTSAYYSTGVGYGALYSLSGRGDHSTAVGAYALYKHTGSDYVTYYSANTAIGYQSLFSNTTGSSNTAVGDVALYYNTTGSGNVAVGNSALYFNVDGSNNTAVGKVAGERLKGSNNTALGWASAWGLVVGDGNTVIGSEAMGIGGSALTLNNNTVVGSQALSGLVNEFPWASFGNNTVMGSQAMFKNASGSGNAAMGFQALYNNGTGNNNTAVGNNSLLANTTGSSNIAVGDSAGSLLTTGSNNIDIGNPGVAAEANTIRIGTDPNQANTFIAGIFPVTIARGQAVFIDSTGHLGSRPSAARFKDAITPMEKASEAVLALQPVIFRYNHELDPDGIPQFGLVAEQVEKVNPDLVLHDDQGKPYTVRYEAVNAMLLNEFLKEHRIVHDLKTTVAEQQKQIKALTSGLQRVSAQLEVSKSAPEIVRND